MNRRLPSCIFFFIAIVFLFAMAGPASAAAPTVTKILPTSGPLIGGTTVTVTGTGFTGATSVKFGTTAATSYTVVSATSITAVSPAGQGPVDITVTTPSGTSATSAADQFTYDPIPTVTGISPTGGPAAGGITVTVTGTGFTGATSVKFGITAGTGLVVASPTSLTIKSPAGQVRLISRSPRPAEPARLQHQISSRTPRPSPVSCRPAGRHLAELALRSPEPGSPVQRP